MTFWFAATKVVEDAVPGFPLASALIDLFHEHAEGAGQHEGRGHGEQPLSHLSVDIDRAGTVQEDKGAGDGRSGAQRKPESQQEVRLAHVRSPPTIEKPGSETRGCTGGR
jgi:hypothetical protein